MVQKSLEPRLWDDDLHLDTRHGHKVFDRERAAVRQLMHLLKENFDDDDRHRRNEVSAEALGASQAAIDALVAADRVLTQTALDDAAAAEVQDPKRQRQVDRELARAQDDLNRRDSEQADNDFYDAIKSIRVPGAMLKRPSRKQPESLENPEAAIEEGAGTGMTMAVATMTASLRKQESL